MEIYLNHSHRYGVEQTVMALLPEHSIQTVDTLPTNPPFLCSFLEFTPHGTGVSTCRLVLDEGTFEGVSEFTLHGRKTEVQDCSQEELQEDLQEEQFAVKDAVFQGIHQFLKRTPPWGSLTGVRPVKMATKWWNKEGDWQKVQGILQNKYHVSPLRGQMSVECGKISQQVQQLLVPEVDFPPCEKNTISLYVGIPFCPSRCGYCSFFSSDVREHSHKVEEYVRGLLYELKETAGILQKESISVSTIYVGGGTPTVLPSSLLEELLLVLNEYFMTDLLEFTVEAGRPDTLDEDKLKVMESCNVGRISINPQTMSNKLLGNLQRNHSAEDVVSLYHKAKDRFQINMDLIAGLPDDSGENILKSLQDVMDLGPSHITMHCLTPKKNTPLAQTICGDAVALQGVLEECWQQLREGGYRPYYLYRQKKIAGGLENVGWVRENDPISLYNVAMMEEFQTIVGCGAGAMSKRVERNSIQRQANPKFYWEYLDKIELSLQQKAQLLSKFSH